MSDCQHEWKVRQGRGHDYIWCERCQGIMHLSTALHTIRTLEAEKRRLISAYDEAREKAEYELDAAEARYERREVDRMKPRATLWGRARAAWERWRKGR